jgi:hypothetical protein
MRRGDPPVLGVGLLAEEANFAKMIASVAKKR